MSGAEDLARLTETIDKTDELLLSPEIKMVEVSPGVFRPTNAMVMANLSTLLGGAMPYTSVAEGLAGTSDGTNFSVVSSAQDEYVNVYRNVGGAAELVDTYPNAEAIKAVSSLIAGFQSAGGEVDYLTVTDVLNGVLARITSKAFRSTAFDIISSEDGVTSMSAADGGQIMYVDALRAIFGPAEFQPATVPGVYITDTAGGVLVDLSSREADPVDASPFKSGILFSPLIATFGSEPVYLYPQNMLARRSRFEGAVATVSSAVNEAVETGRKIPVSYGQFGSDAVLQFRNKADATSHRFITLTVRNVPTQSTPVPIKVLLIGDSIGNRYGGKLLRHYLEAHGYAPTFIGTIPGSGNPTNSNDDTGELGECREGWESGDFTNAVTDRVSVVAPGGEASYMAMTKAQKANINPFLRSASGSDPASFIRNGNIFDPAYYQSRFSLATPDVVVVMPGTNDARDRLASTIQADVLANDTIMLSQIRTAWPDCKIIRCLPGTAINEDRNILWTSHYLPMIRSIQAAVKARADSKLYLAPLWAMSDPESGYFVQTANADENGVTPGDWQDPIHPIASSRAALYKALAAYVAGAAINAL